MDEHKLFKSSESTIPSRGQEVPKASREPIRKLSDIISPDHLELISKSSGGFRFAEDPRLLPNQTGYTIKQTKTIYVNPLMLSGSPEHGITPWTTEDAEGFTYHEAGHHAPEVLEFDDKLISDLKDPENVPQAYRSSTESADRFLGALYRHLSNALVDMWLESYLARRPFYPVRDRITNYQRGKGEISDYRQLSKPEQLMQSLLRSRYFEQANIRAGLDADVFESYERAQKSGAMKAILDRQAFENYFASPADRERTIERKYQAYKQVLLPEYLKLVEAELEKRKQERQQSGPEDGNTGEGGGKGEDGEGKDGAKDKGGKSRSGKGQAGQEAAPLTDEEMKEIAEELLKELEKAAGGHEVHTEDPDHEKAERGAIREGAEKAQAIEVKTKPSSGKGKEEMMGEPQGPRGEEMIRKIARELERQERERRGRGLAESLGVTEQSVRRWEEIKDRYRTEIESLAGSLIEVFTEDRRMRLEYLRRQGEIVPGLEYETIAALVSGDLDPETKLEMVRNPEFLETEIEFVVDISGSMDGEKIERSIELMVIVVEAFRRMHEDLEAENLVMENEEPFRVGVTSFATTPERVSKLDEPLTEAKELKIIDSVSATGSGTEETGAISAVWRDMKLGKRNVIKIMAILTDGEGNRGALGPLLQQIEDDREVLLLAVGLGSGASGVISSYVEPLRGAENVHGVPAENPNIALPAVIEFLKREVGKRKRTL